MDRLVNKLNRKSKKQLQEIYYKMTNKHTNRNKKDIIKELLKPFMKYLGNISLFYQMKMGSKTITLLGEWHNLKCTCVHQNQETPVETYILEYLQQKPSTKVLLEISDKYTKKEINGLGSFNLVNTYQTLIKNGFEKNIIYFDIRYVYISKYMFIIAHNPQKFSQMKTEEIKQQIIYPFQKFWKDRRKMFQLKNEIPSEKLHYITPYIQIDKNTGEYNGKMMKQIVDNFYVIQTNLDKFSRERIRNMLLNTWKQVMDWECIYNIFKSSTDCIVLTGRKHTENYIKILNESGPSITKEANCKKISPRDEIYNTFSGSVDSQGNKCLCDCISI
jgi:hypothetical protein